jgi:hypothetical protein
MRLMTGRALSMSLMDSACHVIGCHSAHATRVHHSFDDLASIIHEFLLQGSVCTGNVMPVALDQPPRSTLSARPPQPADTTYTHLLGRAVHLDPMLTPGVYGYSVRCTDIVQMQGHIFTDIGSDMVVEGDPMKPVLKAPGTKRVRLNYDHLLSNFAFDFNLRRYSWRRACRVTCRRTSGPSCCNRWDPGTLNEQCFSSLTFKPQCEHHIIPSVASSCTRDHFAYTRLLIHAG